MKTDKPSEQSTDEREAELAQTRLLFRQTPIAVFGNITVGVLFIVLLWPRINHDLLIAWGTGLMALTLIRVGLWLRFRRSAAASKLSSQYCLIATLSAFFWGAAGLIPMLQADAVYRIFTVMICTGISGASLATLGSQFRCYAKFLLITMGPIAVVLITQADGILFGSGILALLYIITMTITGYRFSGALKQSLILAREKQLLVDELSNADEIKGEYLARMSHEIRTPLNGVLGMAELLRRTGLDSRQATYLNAVSSSGKALLGVVNEILDFSRISAGRMKLARESLSREELATESLTIFTASAEEKGLKLLVGIEPDVPEIIVGDPIRLRQIIVNLIGNAIKFTDKGSVTLSIERVETQGNFIVLRFTVADTGIGIPQHAQARLFEAFTQAPGASATQSTGSGLGLHISRRLVQLMGGEISLTSALGKGSVFRFTGRFALPASHRFGAQRGAIFTQVNTLLVEGSAEAASVLKSTLESLGARVQLCETAQQACKLLRQRENSGERTELLISEYHLPDSDGVSLCTEALRITHQGVRCILLSPLSTGPDRKAVRQAGISRVVSAPITPNRLSRAMEKAMGVPDESDSDSPLADLYRKFNGMRILVAEDDPVNSVVIEEILRRFDCEPTLVEDGQAALDAFNSAEFQLVLLDCEMPRMDGCEAAAHIRRINRELGGAHLPILAMTAHTGESIRLRMEEAGMDDCIIKPLDLDTVHTAIERWAAPEPADPDQNALPPGPAGELEDQVLDSARTQRLRAMMEGDLSRLIAIYENQADELLEALGSAATSNDSAAMRRALHALIGASSSIGAGRVAHIAEELRQRVIKTASTANSDQLLSEIRIEVDRALNSLLRMGTNTG